MFQLLMQLSSSSSATSIRSVRRSPNPGSSKNTRKPSVIEISDDESSSSRRSTKRRQQTRPITPDNAKHPPPKTSLTPLLDKQLIIVDGDEGHSEDRDGGWTDASDAELVWDGPRASTTSVGANLSSLPVPTTRKRGPGRPRRSESDSESSIPLAKASTKARRGRPKPPDVKKTPSKRKKKDHEEADEPPNKFSDQELYDAVKSMILQDTALHCRILRLEASGIVIAPRPSREPDLSCSPSALTPC